MREFCWTCHRPSSVCFCSQILPFESDAVFALIVHPHEARSTVGTAWILRRSISNIKWLRSNGIGFDEDENFLKLINQPDTVPLLLFPGPCAFNLSKASTTDWTALVPKSKRPLFFIIDGTWAQARSMLRRSKLLRSLPRVSFETTTLSEYGFKKQPRPSCLSSVEGVHRVIETLAFKGWCPLPALHEHNQMIEIFRKMIKFQLEQGLSE